MWTRSRRAGRAASVRRSGRRAGRRGFRTGCTRVERRRIGEWLGIRYPRVTTLRAGTPTRFRPGRRPRDDRLREHAPAPGAVHVGAVVGRPGVAVRRPVRGGAGVPLQVAPTGLATVRQLAGRELRPGGQDVAGWLVWGPSNRPRWPTCSSTSPLRSGETPPVARSSDATPRSASAHLRGDAATGAALARERRPRRPARAHPLPPRGGAHPAHHSRLRRVAHPLSRHANPPRSDVRMPSATPNQRIETHLTESSPHTSAKLPAAALPNHQMSSEKRM